MSPLEDSIENRIREIGEKGKVSSTEVEEAKLKSRQSLHCYEINKKLREPILEILSDRFGINKDYIYPNLKDLGQLSFQDFKP